MPSSKLKHISMLVTVFVLFTVPFLCAAAEGSGTSEQHELSQGQQNIVRRARQVMEIEWTAQDEIISWGRHKNFQAGEVYRGIPYGMPADPAHYVPIGTPFEVFLQAAADPGSLMYTANATRTTLAPFYSSDCSAFISWAWGLDEVHKTWDLSLVTERIGTNLSDIEVGDALNKSAFHVILVSDVERDADGKIIRLGTMELTDPIAKMTWYGEGERLSLGSFRQMYLTASEDSEDGVYDGYTIIRFTGRDDVKYVHSCAVPIDFDFCSNCFDRSLPPLQRLINARLPALVRELREQAE